MSIVEVVLAMLIVSIVVAGALNAIGETVKQQRVHVEHARAMALAQDLLNEITICAYEDTSLPTFGPEAGETRATYDDVDDFNGLKESPPLVGLGLPATTWDGWTRAVSVGYATVGKPGVGMLSDSGLKHITVSVTAPSGKSWTIDGLRARAGLYDKKADRSGAYTARVGVTLEIGDDPATALQQSAALANTVP